MWDVSSSLAGRDHSCCYEWESRGSRRRACRLGHATKESASAPLVPLGDAGRLRIFVGGQAGRVEEIVAYAASCPVEAREPVRELEPRPDAAASVALLAGFGRDSRRRVVDGALAAIAQHDHESATGTLEQYAQDAGASEKTRTQAAFWLGVARKAPGLEALRRLRASWPDSLRDELAFPIAQSTAEGAMAELIDLARGDSLPKVRAQAIFWLSQKASEKSAPTIVAAATQDTDPQVQLQAIFALSQLRDGEGIEPMIAVVKTHPSAEVRRQALFWLGQSKDARAIRLFEDILLGSSNR